MRVPKAESMYTGIKFIMLTQFCAHYLGAVILQYQVNGKRERIVVASMC